MSEEEEEREMGGGGGGAKVCWPSAVFGALAAVSCRPGPQLASG